MFCFVLSLLVLFCNSLRVYHFKGITKQYRKNIQTVKVFLLPSLTHCWFLVCQQHAGNSPTASCSSEWPLGVNYGWSQLAENGIFFNKTRRYIVFDILRVDDDKVQILSGFLKEVV